MPQPLSKTDLKRISDKYPEGIPSHEIVDIFQSRGFRFSEATFRKYVQMGLVERCRRVGRKGKHRGSHGLYPVSAVERINSIKKMISGDLTLEQLKCSYFSTRQKVEEIERLLTEIQKDINEQQRQDEHLEKMDSQINREVAQVSKQVGTLIRTLEKAENVLISGT